MKAYHILNYKMQPFYGKEKKPWKIGETRSVEGDIAMCRNGYHASPSLLEASSYAGVAEEYYACLVELSGDQDAGHGFNSDKYCFRTRKLLKAIRIGDVPIEGESYDGLIPSLAEICVKYGIKTSLAEISIYKKLLGIVYSLDDMTEAVYICLRLNRDDHTMFGNLLDLKKASKIENYVLNEKEIKMHPYFQYRDSKSRTGREKQRIMKIQEMLDHD